MAAEVVEIVVEPICKCSFCEAPSAFSFNDVAQLNACRDHLLEAIEWVAA